MTSSLGTSSAFFKALSSSWALFLGFGILMLGDGLQATLLAVRADQEGFSTFTTGIVMSSFYVGFLGGSLLTPRIVTQVGHVRAFAALAALASAAILVHAVFVQAPVWIVLRLISGLCFAGLYVVAESWLNDRATNETRGLVLSLYMVITYVGVGIGQLFLNLADPSGFPLFVLTSVLISIAVVPLLLSAGPAPKFEESVGISLKELFHISPLGVVGMFVVGLVVATFFALGPVYGQRIGLDLENISYFMTAAVAGTVIFQFPIGALSDRFDRRRVLAVLTILTSIAAYACIPLTQLSNEALLLGVGIFGGLAMPLYSVCIAHTNDHLEPEQMIAASGSLVLVAGLGSAIGPILVAGIMDYFDDSAFFWSLAVAHGLTGLYALYRMLRQAPTPLEKQRPQTLSPIHHCSSAVENIQQLTKEQASELTKKK